MASTGSSASPDRCDKVVVGTDEVNPGRYQALAWVHIAGLTVFAVFAAWWMIGALQSRREPRTRPQGRGAQRSRRPAPVHAVSVAEQFFGTDDPDTVRHQVDTFLVRHLRVGIREIEFTKVGTGIVLGVLAVDGQRLVVKIHPPGTNTPYLRAIQDVQIHLAVQGYPAPKPVLDPQPFGVGVATVESRLPEPPPADPGDPATRRALAEGLAAFVRFASPLARHAELAGRGPLRPPAAGSVFPPPPGSPFDFPATAAGAEWIEEIGARARTLLEAAPRTAPVVGHFDWRSENIPVSGGRVVAVFDWDSVGAATEPIVVGSATHHFTLDWRSSEPARAHPRRGARLRRRLRSGPGPARSPRPSGSRPGPPTSSAPPTAPAASTCWRRAASRRPPASGTGWRLRARPRSAKFAPAGTRTGRKATGTWHSTSSRARRWARRRCRSSGDPSGCSPTR